MGARRTSRDYFESTARQRIDGLLDPGSFRELCPPPERAISPHLGRFGLPAAFDDGAVVGEGRLDGRAVCVAAQEGRFMGGAIGEVHGARIVGILRRCLEVRPAAMLMLLDSGGVRLQEANAGEVAVAEIVRAVLDVRAAGIPVVAAVGGVCGAFGGAGIVAGCCDAVVVSEEGRIGVSGPEVIETTMGVDVFDSRDRALVWRTYGGANRYLQGTAREIVENSIGAFRGALAVLVGTAPDHSLEGLERERRALEERAARFAGCRDAREIWRAMGIGDPETLSSAGAAGLRAAKGCRGGGS